MARVIGVGRPSGGPSGAGGDGKARTRASAQASVSLGEDIQGEDGDRWVRFPPGMRNVWVPVSGRRAGAAGVCLYTASRWTGVAGQSVVYWATRLCGPRILPARRVKWTPPVPPALWDELRLAWRESVGPWDAFAVYERKHASRAGVGLMLLRDGEQTAFVKLRPAGQRLMVEREVLERLTAAPLPGVQIPRVVAGGTCADWDWLATAPLPAKSHRPPRHLDVDGLCDVIDKRLLDAISPPAKDAPAHWRPMHGDLTPWNVRRLPDGRLWVLDWEDAQWGPPGADAAYYRAIAAVLYREDPGKTSAEVAAYWLDKIATRANGDDARLNTRLTDVLRTMSQGGPRVTEGRETHRLPD